MAAQARRAIGLRSLARKGARGFAVAVAALLALLALYAVAGWIGSSLPAHRGWEEARGPDAVEIMIGSNGVHTEIVMPRVNSDMDWTRLFPAGDLAVNPGGRIAAPYTHVAIGWGEREVFLGTPTWADLSPVTVARIVATGGEGLLHVSHYVRPAPSTDYRPLRISRAEYRALVTEILQSVRTGGGRRAVYPGYLPQDVFYDAEGTYTVFTTCNEWTGGVLRRAGIATGAWTPFAGGVMKWVPKP
ncbi:DUF2459 domain-containing protein [uncultured Croceicoccus sp.]|uniref:DUF2459 domain-containing protein n=1 Tax=uncultured Croceicoccus sp. TaxID=1295329 RepID=UPI00260A893D|nr:DUF2459 domain-containing protein [uncultured Croceicoccus sp.]